MAVAAEATEVQTRGATTLCSQHVVSAPLQVLAGEGAYLKHVRGAVPEHRLPNFCGMQHVRFCNINAVAGRAP